MSSPVDDTADEVKVFRSSDVDEVLDTAQSSQQLSEDKKDVAYEAEMDTPTSNINAQNLFFNPALFSSTMFGTMPNMYPVIMQQALSPHFNRIIPSQPLNLLSPHFAALSMCSPQYAKPQGFTPSIAAFMSPQASFLAQNFSNPMAAQNLQKFIAQQQMQNNARNAENVNPNAHHHIPTPKRERVQREKKDKNHIKKPCNAFMIFMQENRKKFSNGSTVKQSSELNKEMGKAWHSLTKEEQEKYFDMAKEARDNHAKLYPHWTARENYAINKKKRKKRDRSPDPNSENNEQKKCRARFGIENTDRWCKHCRRKKRCLLVRTTDSPVVSSTTNPTTPSHMFSSPQSAVSSSSTMLSPAPFMPL